MKRSRSLISSAVLRGSIHFCFPLLSTGSSFLVRTSPKIILHLKILHFYFLTWEIPAFPSVFLISLCNFCLHLSSLQRWIHTPDICVAISIPTPDRRFPWNLPNVCPWCRLMFSSTIEQRRRTKCSTVCSLRRIAANKILDDLTREVRWRRVRLMYAIRTASLIWAERYA